MTNQIKTKSAVFQLRIEPELMAEFKRICDERAIPVSVFIRQFIVDVCKRDKLRQETELAMIKQSIIENASNS